MVIKKVLSNILKKSTDNFIAENTVSVLTGGLEDMPKYLKKTR